MICVAAEKISEEREKLGLWQMVWRLRNLKRKAQAMKLTADKMNDLLNSKRKGLNVFLPPRKADILKSGVLHLGKILRCSNELGLI